MSVPSKLLVFDVPQTCMSVFHHESSGLYLGLDRYEGWLVEMFYQDIVFVLKILVRFQVNIDGSCYNPLYRSYPS